MKIENMSQKLKKEKNNDKVTMKAVDTDKVVSCHEEKEEELRIHIIAVWTWVGKEFPDIEHHVKEWAY